MKSGLSIRTLVINLLYRVNPGDITIRHHYTGQKFRLHSFQHKDYWAHGRDREKNSMSMFSRMIRSGDLIIEVGGHIGYISAYFASLAGPQGRVVVFEPGPNNLPYLRKNTAFHSNIILVEKAVTDHEGISQFYIEYFSGQNNSLFDNRRILDSNLRSAGLQKVQTNSVEVSCTTLDTYLAGAGLIIPSFVKIDVEGAELVVLKGMRNTLEQDGIALMIEVTENQYEIFQLLRANGFIMFDDSGKRAEDVRAIGGNIFCLKENDSRIGISFPQQGDRLV
jgi:FkbM family methyltransferase